MSVALVDTRAPARGGFVQVPRELLRAGLRSAQIAVWILLVARTRPDEPNAWTGQERLLWELGRRARRGKDGRVHGDSITEITKALERAGWLRIERRHYLGQTRNQYTPLGTAHRSDHRAYAELPMTAIDAMQTGEMLPEDLVALARWIDAGGSYGWTSSTLTQHSETYGVCVSAAKESRSRLVAQGLLEVERRAGRGTLTGRPGALSTRVRTGPLDAVSPGHQKPYHRATRSRITGPPDAVSPGHQMPYEVPQEEVPQGEVPQGEAPASAPLGVDRHLGSAARSATTPAAKPGRSTSTPSQTAWGLLAEMPTPRRAPQHFRVAMAGALDRALESGYGPGALRRACVGVEYREDAAERHVPALRAALEELAGCVKAGTWCGWCGQDKDQPRRQTCEDCNPDLPLTQEDLEALDQLRRNAPPRGRAPATVTHLEFRREAS